MCFSQVFAGIIFAGILVVNIFSRPFLVQPRNRGPFPICRVSHCILTPCHKKYHFALSWAKCSLSGLSVWNVSFPMVIPIVMTYSHKEQRHITARSTFSKSDNHADCLWFLSLITYLLLNTSTARYYHIKEQRSFAFSVYKGKSAENNLYVKTSFEIILK